MKNPDILFEREDNWETTLGGSILGERVVLHGKDLFNELRGMPWIGHLLYALTGRIFKENEVKMLEAIWCLTVSYPDPRVWPNRIAALAGTTRSTGGLALSSALAISEAEVWGHRANSQAIDFIIRAKQTVDAGEDLWEFVSGYIKRNRRTVGYGRAFGDCDERIEPIREIAEELGFGDGPHLKLAFEIDELLRKSRYRLFMNSAGIGAALGADMGFSPREYYYFALPSFTAGIMPCFVDAEKHEEGTFFPIRCSSIEYEGEPVRRWDA